MIIIIVFVKGIRKKRAAPQPPVSRPLSSAISSQALERIVDSEESLTSDMGVSKPPSDIAASETETHSKANSDIVVGSHTIKTIGDFNFDSLPKRDLVKLSKDSSQIDAFEPVKKAPIPIEVSVVIEKKSSTPVEKVPTPPAPVEALSVCQENNYLEARVKRGKFVRSTSSFDDNEVAFSFVSQNSYEKIYEDEEIENNINYIGKKSIDKFNYFENDNKIKLKLDKNYQDRRKNLLKISNIKLDNIENSNGRMINRTSDKLNIDKENSDRWMVKYSRSLNSNDCNQRRALRSKDRVVGVSDLKLEEDPAIKTANNNDNLLNPSGMRTRKSNSISEYDVFKNNSSSRLSNLEILDTVPPSITEKPVDIKKAPVGAVEDIILNDIKGIPSFPLSNKSNVNIGINNKLSILKPPPPGLVSRQESNENWNNFINRLNFILDSKLEEFFV